MVDLEDGKKRSMSHEMAKIMAVVVVGIIVAGLAIGMLPKILETGKQMGLAFNPPNAIVTSENCRTGMSGLDYVAWVDVSIHNDGGAGIVVVWVQVTQGSGGWTKSQSLYLSSQESKDLTFAFSEVSFWTTARIYYWVWVE